MRKCNKPDGPAAAGSKAAFLAAQVGAHAASKFAARLAKLKLAPAHAGILRILNAGPAITQQKLAQILGMVPSRLVILIDDMEARDLIERRQHPDDRRRYALYLGKKGPSVLKAIGVVAQDHAKALLAALSEDEKGQLADLLQRIADQQGLVRGVHPGYRRIKLGAKSPPPKPNRSQP